MEEREKKRALANEKRHILDFVSSEKAVCQVGINAGVQTQICSFRVQAVGEHLANRCF